MRITIKHLEYFVAAGEAGSIKRAAEGINISQPSISSAIATLERELGVQLFVRHHAQGISLTSTGKIMMREAKLLLRQFGALYTIAAEQNNEIRGQLSIGCMTTIAAMIIPQLGHKFMAENSAVHLKISQGSHEVLLAELKQVQIDAAIFYDLELTDDIEFIPLASLSPHILVAADDPLARREILSLEELASKPMVLLDLPHTRQYFLSLFESRKLTPTIAEHATTIELSRSLVANGFGYTIANAHPRNQMALDGKKLVSVKLSGRHKPVTIGLATLAQDLKPKVLRAFEAFCRKTITSKSVPGMDFS
jgi:DNA-binding transcriptional LysR family regulator